jgi:hypothetical protein
MNELMHDGGWSTAQTSDRFYGEHLVFKEGQWLSGAEKAPVKKGLNLLATGTSAFWIRWQGKNVADRADASLPRSELGYEDRSQWEPGLDGQPGDPWRFVKLVDLIDPMTLAEYRFETTTKGGHACIDELISRVNKARQIRPGATPILTLTTRPMRTRLGITRPRPCFNVEGWRFPDDAWPLLPPSPSLPPPPSPSGGMSDAIPF